DPAIAITIATRCSPLAPNAPALRRPLPSSPDAGSRSSRYPIEHTPSVVGIVGIDGSVLVGAPVVAPSVCPSPGTLTAGPHPTSPHPTALSQPRISIKLYLSKHTVMRSR